MGHICALLLSGSDIRFLGTTGPEPEPETDIRYIPISNGQTNRQIPKNCLLLRRNNDEYDELEWNR